ncbi:hypothetical protein JOB18_035841 [Solea senegalensis]|uniref:Secreted protein n=1 Tax=Solea senegalensis TaxID=28829 RepID=A0AAV6PYB2_SOLSE|nr:hypothetical protein JOB18_035841 [Solea senegalensis]
MLRTLEQQILSLIITITSHLDLFFLLQHRLIGSATFDSFEVNLVGSIQNNAGFWWRFFLRTRSDQNADVKPAMATRT